LINIYSCSKFQIIIDLKKNRN